ncbi:hypothetical protein P154DRAFT_540291 [Amniculicola lignicola CBS 123094]|uniref:Uncharacterized protein n=1 Tax=Amniculicola lignicola CBS 123094 TaxID=1392246 RepID=A0A6A5VUY0_9PLEO|nr:hypothetical protein P154DRAFT_540291 [Amniculicola lignicola CBS 123094]
MPYLIYPPGPYTRPQFKPYLLTSTTTLDRTILSDIQSWNWRVRYETRTEGFEAWEYNFRRWERKIGESSGEGIWKVWQKAWGVRILNEERRRGEEERRERKEKKRGERKGQMRGDGGGDGEGRGGMVAESPYMVDGEAEAGSGVKRKSRLKRVVKAVGHGLGRSLLGPVIQGLSYYPGTAPVQGNAGTYTPSVQADNRSGSITPWFGRSRSPDSYYPGDREYTDDESGSIAGSVRSGISPFSPPASVLYSDGTSPRTSRATSRATSPSSSILSGRSFGMSSAALSERTLTPYPESVYEGSGYIQVESSQGSLGSRASLNSIASVMTLGDVLVANIEEWGNEAKKRGSERGKRGGDEVGLEDEVGCNAILEMMGM